MEVASEEQSNQMLTLTKLDKAEVAVMEHARLNQIQGTIRYANKPNYKIDIILWGRVDDLSFFEYLSPFVFLSIEFHCTFSISYKILPYFVYYYSILIRL